MARKSQAGRCRLCGSALETIYGRGPCNLCRAKELERQALDGLAKPKDLTRHPDLAELDEALDSLEEFYG